MDTDIDITIKVIESQLNKLIESNTLATKEETIQNELVNLSKYSQKRQDINIIKCKISYLKKLKQIKLENTLPEVAFNNLLTSITKIDENFSQFWLLINNIEELDQNTLSFLVDKNPFMKGDEVYSHLKNMFQLYNGKEVIEIKINNENNNQHQNNHNPMIEVEAAILQLKNKSSIDKIFFMNFECISLSKIQFISKLQSDQLLLKISTMNKLIIYTDDINSQQLKKIISPCLEIMFERQNMPQNIQYLNSKINPSEKSKMIQSICQDTITKYKQSLKEFDIIIFVKNQEEGSKLKSLNLCLIQERLNVIDLTLPISQDEYNSVIQIEKNSDEENNHAHHIPEILNEESQVEFQENENNNHEILMPQTNHQSEIEFITPEFLEIKRINFPPYLIGVEENKDKLNEVYNFMPMKNDDDIFSFEQKKPNLDQLQNPPLPFEDKIELPTLDVSDPLILQQQEEQKRKEEERIALEEQKAIVAELDKEQANEARKEREAIPFRGIVDEMYEEENEEIENSQLTVSERQIEEKNSSQINVYIANNHEQLSKFNLSQVLVQIDTGEAEHMYFFNDIFENIPIVNFQITQKEAIKRERIMGEKIAGQIYRLFSRKEFARLQNRNSLHLFNLQSQNQHAEIMSETCQKKQSVRLLLHFVMNQTPNWFSCTSETEAHVSLLQSKSGDVHSIFNCIAQIPNINEPFAKENNNLEQILERNQISSKQFNCLLSKLHTSSSEFKINTNPLIFLKNLNLNQFSQLLQQIVIEKYYNNLCAYSGNRRQGYFHFESKQHFNYSNLSSMRLIQERPFLLLPIQLSLNSQNQYEIQQCIAIDHSLFLENAPTSFINKHNLSLLNRKSSSFHEIEYFGIPHSLFTYFDKHQSLIQNIEREYNCFYEPNKYMDSITIECDPTHKDKIEQKFKELIDEARKELIEEVIDFPHGKNSIIRIEKGGIIKEIVILENEHVFIIEGLPADTKEKELIDLCSEYGEALHVTLTKSKNDTMQAEILVSETEDGSFFAEIFNKIDFRGHLITARLKNHSFQIHSQNDNKYYNIFSWQTWKSNQTAKVEFTDQSAAESFLKGIQQKLVIDGKVVEGMIEKGNSKIMIVKNLKNYTDEKTIKDSLPQNIQLLIKHIQVDRIPDVDRGISTIPLINMLKKQYAINKINIAWIKKRENGIVEAKVINNDLNELYLVESYHEQPNILGYGKVYMKHFYTKNYKYDLTMKDILHVIISGNKQLVEMQLRGDIILKFKVIRPMPSKEEYLMKLKCFDQYIFENAKKQINLLIMSQKLDLKIERIDLQSLFDEENQLDYSQIFTELGIQKLKEIEKKYPIYFKVNHLKQDIRVFCTNSIFSLANKDIEQFLRQSMRIQIPVSRKNIKDILGFDGKGLEQLKKKYEICKIELDCISQDVKIEGNPKQIEQAKNSLLALLEEKNSSSTLNNSLYSTEDCMVCSDTIVTGYRLQGCSHKFCYSCVMFIIENSLKDINSLPIKCPFCSKEFVIKDLQALMTEEYMQKMLRMSLNNYVSKHFEEVNFCANQDCRSVHSSKLSKYTCYECKKTYCAKCSVEYHFGLTCTVYQSTEAKNVAYLLKEGARKCPKCGVYIIRFDGCYRVECNKCESHICWKDNCMKYYDNSEDCYNHLDEKHGGYW